MVLKKITSSLTGAFVASAASGKCVLVEAVVMCFINFQYK
jgi:hypothetical protein